MTEPAHGVSIESRTTGEKGSPNVSFAVSGDFDSAQVDTFETATAGIPDDAQSVLVDVTDCRILDSASLGALVRLKLRLEERGCEFSISAERPFQRQILDNTGLGEYLGLRKPG